MQSRGPEFESPAPTYVKSQAQPYAPPALVLCVAKTGLAASLVCFSERSCLKG